jgi:hypothetical protein
MNTTALVAAALHMMCFSCVLIPAVGCSNKKAPVMLFAIQSANQQPPINA